MQCRAVNASGNEPLNIAKEEFLFLRFNIYFCHQCFSSSLCEQGQQQTTPMFKYLSVKQKCEYIF